MTIYEKTLPVRTIDPLFVTKKNVNKIIEDSGYISLKHINVTCNLNNQFLETRDTPCYNSWSNSMAGASAILATDLAICG